MKSAFSKGFLLKNHLLRAYCLGFDWPRWIALIKDEISHYEGNGLAGQFWQMESALSFTDKDWNLVPGILTPQRGIQNPLLSCRCLLHGGWGGGGKGWVAFDIELRTIEDLNSRRWQINPGIFCDISNFFLWLLARYSPEKLFWFLPKAVYLVTLPLIPASPLRILSNFCLWNPESCALESGIQMKEYGMPLMIWIRNSNSSCKLRNPVRNRESKTVLDSLTWGKAIKRAIPISIALWD